MNQVLGLCAVMLMGAFSGPARAQAVTYVDASALGANDGSSWGDAFVDLQAGLSTAGAGDQLWVAAGSYTPAPPGGPSSATFAIPSGVEVYGGFGGGETALSQRDPAANPTVLSGDLLGDDTYTPIFNVGFGDNVWHVVSMDGASGSTRIDGFSIIAGSEFGATGAEANGAGVRILNGGGVVANCELSWCVASSGGGLYVSASDAVVEGCHFHNNYGLSVALAGGAIANDNGSNLTVRDSSFQSNTARSSFGVGGGALANHGSASANVERCSFSYNLAGNPFVGASGSARGGAIYNNHGNLTVSQSSFIANTSNSGGAVFAWDNSNTALVNCLFDGNYVTKYVASGGIELGGDGGAVVGDNGLVMVGCLVTGGDADNIGGVSAGAGLVSSCILWGNQDDKGNIGNSQIKADEVRYSCVQNMLVGEPGEDPPDPTKFPGSTSADPRFANPLAGDYRLTAGSPLIDAAENPAWPAGMLVDLDEHARFVDDAATPDTGVGPAPIGDMGPYEFGSLPAILSYCTAGTSASGCQALLSASGTASATAPTGFALHASGVEGNKDGLFFFGANGRQANPWGNGTSYQCVVPPVQRAGLLAASGTAGACDGGFSLDLNALWCPTCPKPSKNPGPGAVVQSQLWYRDPASSSNATTSLSDALEFIVAP